MKKFNINESQYINRWAKTIKAIEHCGGKCVECGKSDPILLDFHHKTKTNKKEDVSRILQGWVFAECIEELNRCVLLCCKCHRKKHFDYVKFNQYLPNIIERSKKVHETESRIRKYRSKKEMVINMLMEGKAYREINKDTGMSRNAIKRLALHLDIDRTAYTNEIPINEEEFLELYNKGATYSFICQHFRISEYPLHRLRKKLLDMGEINRRKGSPPKIERILV